MIYTQEEEDLTRYIDDTPNYGFHLSLSGQTGIITPHLALGMGSFEDENFTLSHYILGRYETYYSQLFSRGLTMEDLIDKRILDAGAGLSQFMLRLAQERRARGYPPIDVIDIYDPERMVMMLEHARATLPDSKIIMGVSAIVPIDNAIGIAREYSDPALFNFHSSYLPQHPPELSSKFDLIFDMIGPIGNAQDKEERDRIHALYQRWLADDGHIIYWG
jgi:hypothetical protein